MAKKITIQQKPSAFRGESQGWHTVGSTPTKREAISLARRIIEVKNINPIKVAIQKRNMTISGHSLQSGKDRILKSRFNWLILIRT